MPLRGSKEKRQQTGPGGTQAKARRQEGVQKRVSSRYQRRYKERAEGKTPEQQKAIQERMFGRMQGRLGQLGVNPFGTGYDASMMAQAPTWQRPPAGPLGAGAGGGANAPQTGPGGMQPPVMPPPIPQGQIQPWNPMGPGFIPPFQPGFGQYGGQFPPWMQPGGQQQNPFQGYGQQQNPFGGMFGGLQRR